MNSLKTVVELGAAAVISFPLALGIEWLCLRGVFCLMPAQARVAGYRRVEAASRSERLERAA